MLKMVNIFFTEAFFFISKCYYFPELSNLLKILFDNEGFNKNNFSCAAVIEKLVS